MSYGQKKQTILNINICILMENIKQLMKVSITI